MQDAYQRGLMSQLLMQLHLLIQREVKLILFKQLVVQLEKVKNQNVQMLINFLNALEAGTSQLKHISCLHGTGYYGSYVRINPIKFPSLETRPPVEGNTIFYMAQEEILRKAAKQINQMINDTSRINYL